MWIKGTPPTPKNGYRQNKSCRHTLPTSLAHRLGSGNPRPGGGVTRTPTDLQPPIGGGRYIRAGQWARGGLVLGEAAAMAAAHVWVVGGHAEAVERRARAAEGGESEGRPRPRLPKPRVPGEPRADVNKKSNPPSQHNENALGKWLKKMAKEKKGALWGGAISGILGASPI